MKSQGLPINFIVLAAIAILILILVVGFVIGGGTAFERGVAPGVARSNCNSWCSALRQEAYYSEPSEDFEEDSAFCENTQVVDGVGTYCSAESGASHLGIQCLLTFRDGSSRYAKCPLQRQ